LIFLDSVIYFRIWCCKDCKRF